MVAKADAKNRAGTQTSMTWFEAWGMTDATYNPKGYSACPQYSEEPDQSDMGTWRLPTIRELKVISDMSVQKKLTAVNLPAVRYWAATFRTDGDLVWFVDFRYNSASHLAKYDRFYVRCVRDL